MNPIKRLAIALMAVLMIGLMLFYFVSLLLAKIAMAVLLVVAILIALIGSRRPKDSPGSPVAQVGVHSLALRPPAMPRTSSFPDFEIER